MTEEEGTNTKHEHERGFFMIIDEKTKDAFVGILIVAAGVCTGEWMFMISKTVAKFLYGVAVALIGILL